MSWDITCLYPREPDDAVSQTVTKELVEFSSPSPADETRTMPALRKFSDCNPDAL